MPPDVTDMTADAVSDTSGRWLTVPAAARALSVTERTIRRRMAAGAVRIRREDGRTLIWVSLTPPGHVTDIDTDMSADVSDAAAEAIKELARLLEHERTQSAALEQRASKAEQTAAMYQERARNLAEENERLSIQLALPPPARHPWWQWWRRM